MADRACRRTRGLPPRFLSPAPGPSCRLWMCENGRPARPPVLWSPSVVAPCVYVCTHRLATGTWSRSAVAWCVLCVTPTRWPLARPRRVDVCVYVRDDAGEGAGSRINIPYFSKGAHQAETSSGQPWRVERPHYNNIPQLCNSRNFQVLPILYT